MFGKIFFLILAANLVSCGITMPALVPVGLKPLNFFIFSLSPAANDEKE
jgi:hypothetical protein